MYLLISWLQSLSTVILEPKKIKSALPTVVDIMVIWMNFIHSHPFYLFSIFLEPFKIFNCRIITSQNCDDFCHTSTWIGHRYTYILSLLSPSPASLPLPPFRLSHSTGGSLSHTSNSHWLHILHMVMCMFQCYSLKSSTLSFPHCVQKSVLYVCVSFAALHIGSSVLSF